MDENGFPNKIHQLTEMVRMDDLENIIRDVLYRELGAVMTPAIANGTVTEILRRMKLKGQSDA